MTQVRFFEVSEDELEKQRSAFSNGQLEIKIEEDNFSMKWVVCIFIACPDVTSYFSMKWVVLYTHCLS